MTIKERIEKYKKDGFVFHTCYPKGIKIIPEYDIIRIYKTTYSGCIENMLYYCKIKDIDTIPEDILNLEFTKEHNLLGGGFFWSLEIIEKENIKINDCPNCARDLSFGECMNCGYGMYEDDLELENVSEDFLEVLEDSMEEYDETIRILGVDLNEED